MAAVRVGRLVSANDQARAKCINNALDSESSSCDCGNRFFFVYFVVQLKDQLPIWRRDFSRFLRMRGNNVNEMKHQANGMHFWKCKQPVSQGALSRKTHDIIERVLWKRGERCMSDLGQETLQTERAMMSEVCASAKDGDQRCEGIFFTFSELEEKVRDTNGTFPIQPIPGLILTTFSAGH